MPSRYLIEAQKLIRQCADGLTDLRRSCPPGEQHTIDRCVEQIDHAQLIVDKQVRGQNPDPRQGNLL